MTLHLDQPSDDIDEEFARRLIRSSTRTREEMPVILVDPETSEADMMLASSLLGQTVRRRPRQ